MNTTVEYATGTLYMGIFWFRLRCKAGKKTAAVKEHDLSFCILRSYQTEVPENGHLGPKIWVVVTGGIWYLIYFHDLLYRYTMLYQ